MPLHISREKAGSGLGLCIWIDVLFQACQEQVRKYTILYLWTLESSVQELFNGTGIWGVLYTVGKLFISSFQKKGQFVYLRCTFSWHPLLFHNYYSKCGYPYLMKILSVHAPPVLLNTVLLTKSPFVMMGMLCTTSTVQGYVVHQWPAFCTMVHKGGLCLWEVVGPMSLRSRGHPPTFFIFWWFTKLHCQPWYFILYEKCWGWPLLLKTYRSPFCTMVHNAGRWCTT